ncbi:MAG: type II toxin-antitoxin system VapC family toxin [Spirochaetaceae bacterium]|nr:type II toxin-antitoxin system VapC family toxin [Spirochaetaceae bacterium]
MDLVDANGFELLPVDKEPILQLEKLPFIHRDPFDRLLVATAISEKLYIVTKDDNINQYSINTIW